MVTCIKSSIVDCELAVSSRFNFPVVIVADLPWKSLPLDRTSEVLPLDIMVNRVGLGSCVFHWIGLAAATLDPARPKEDFKAHEHS